MLEKVYFGGTYGYRDFISDTERKELEEWALSIEDKMGFSVPINDEQDQYSNNVVRHFLILKPEDEKPLVFHTLKEKIIQLENIQNPIPAPQNYDWIGIVGENGYVEPHIDDNLEDHYTVRYNVIVSCPNKGGNPIYGGEIIPIEEKMVWRCDAGVVPHSSQIVKDTKLRINLSFGFSFKF
jgi:hypothetical protein